MAENEVKENVENQENKKEEVIKKKPESKHHKTQYNNPNEDKKNINVIDGNKGGYSKKVFFKKRYCFFCCLYCS